MIKLRKFMLKYLQMYSKSNISYLNIKSSKTWFIKWICPTTSIELVDINKLSHMLLRGWKWSERCGGCTTTQFIITFLTTWITCTTSTATHTWKTWEFSLHLSSLQHLQIFCTHQVTKCTKWYSALSATPSTENNENRLLIFKRSNHHKYVNET